MKKEIYNMDTTLPATTARYAWIDGLRSIAALSVFFAHSLVHHSEPDTWLYWCRGVFGLGGVAVFLIVSGYVVVKSLQSRSVVSFWRRRFWRLYPAFWLAILLYLATGVANTSDPLHVLINITMIPGLLGVPYVFGVFWTLSAEMVWYTLASLGLHHARLVWLALPASLLLRLVLPDPLRMAGWLPLFAIGAAVYHQECGTMSRHHVLLLTGAALPIALFAQRSQDATGALLALLLCSVVYLLRARLQIPSALLWCGTISYSLYLLHYIVILAVPLHWFLPWHLAMPIWLAVSLLLAWGVYRYVERPLMHGLPTARRTTPQPSPQ
jgi:peptidoglycan/LPS O-acetylase OafA/YrhL